MGDKKRKWERDYEQYSNSTELDEKISYLKYCVDGKNVSKEKYGELKKLTAIKENLPKVKNILELKDQLLAQKDEIEKELVERQKMAKVNQECEKLEEELQKLEAEKATLEEELKNNPEKKEEIQKKLKENESKIQKNNVEFGDRQEELSEHRRAEEKKAKQGKENKFKGKSTEELQNEVMQISSNISKCNLACNKLMQGYSWQSVEVTLDKYEKERYTAKGKNAKKMQQNRIAAKEANAKSEIEKPEAEKPEAAKPEAEKPEPAKPEAAMIPQTRWQKAKQWLRNAWTNFSDKFLDDDKEIENDGNKKSLFSKLKDAVKNIIGKEEAEKEVAPKPVVAKKEVKEPEKKEEPKQEEIKEEPKQDTFRQYLRDVAAKGIDGIEQERLDAEKAEKEARRQAAIEKLKANREGKDTGAIVTNLDKQLQNQNNEGR